MRKSSVAAILALAAVSAFPSFVHAKKKGPTTAPTTQSAEEQAAAYDRAIDKRAAAIVTTLGIDDAAKAARVHDIIAGQYHALQAWQDANETSGKSVAGDPEKQASLAALHDQYLAKLSAELTPEQVEKVKDGMTVNKVKVTYDSYLEIVPNLTDEEKAKMLELLKQAREEAIDGRSMEQKSAIFKKYKGKINIYLDSHGHHVAQAYKDWGQAQKSKRSGSTTEPSASDD